MLKMNASLVPRQVWYSLQNIEGFRQVQPLGSSVELTDPETGAVNKLYCSFARTRNTGVMTVITNTHSPMHRDIVLEEGGNSSVHVAFYKRPDEVVGLIETFLDALQSCYIYDSGRDQALQKQSLIDDILNGDFVTISI